MFSAEGRIAAFLAQPEKQANESNVVAATAMSAIAHALFILLPSFGVVMFYGHIMSGRIYANNQQLRALLMVKPQLRGCVSTIFGKIRAGFRIFMLKVSNFLDKNHGKYVTNAPIF